MEEKTSVGEGPVSADGLGDWIKKNMTADPPNALGDHKERAAKHVAVATDGSVVLRSNGNRSARQKILGHFVGKQYSVAAGYSQEPVVENQDLVTGLTLPEGTVGRCLKELRDGGLIKQVANGKHVLPLANLGRALTELDLE